MTEYTLPGSDGRTVQFTGVLLSTASSQRPDALRWTEISIYRTQAGKYVIHKVGRTVVYHRTGQPCTSGSTEIKGDMRNALRPCPKCSPVLNGAVSTSPLTFEEDRHTVHVTETGDGVVESAHTQDADGTAYLTRPAKQALLSAAARDGAIRNAYYVQRID
jgi:hypothetical protein